ncbi:MAG: hypothetical protein ACXVQQ_05300, partial [Gaiellaceae bacterium]
MSGCCRPEGYNRLFSARQARLDASRYRKHGLGEARGDLDARRALGTGCEQLELDRANAASDVEHARAGHVAGELGERPRRA